MLSKTHSKYIQSLHHKKFRDADGVFIAEGNKVVLELIQSGKFVCRELFALKNWLLQNESAVRPYYKGPVHEVADFELEKISVLSTPNQVLGIFNRNATKSFNPKSKITLVLDHLQDPGNLGTIIRIADWFGVENIVCSPQSADVFNPKVVQSTMGSLGRVEVYYQELEALFNTYSFIRRYAAALDGKPLSELKSLQEGFIIIGNESKGISESVLKLANDCITIPRTGQAESLNAAVAAGIILSHL